MEVHISEVLGTLWIVEVMGMVVPFTPECVTDCAISINGRADGASVRFTNINGKYYISVLDLIIGTCKDNPRKDKESWEKACTYASNTWNTGISKQKKDELGKYLEKFQFPGDSWITHSIKCFRLWHFVMTGDN